MNEILDQQYADGYSKEITRDFFKSVYSYMFVALGLSGLVAYWAASTGFVFKYFLTETGGISPLYYVILFAPVGLALMIQMAYHGSYFSSFRFCSRWFRWDGNSWLYNENRSHKDGKLVVHGVYWHFHCWNCKYFHR